MFSALGFWAQLHIWPLSGSLTSADLLPLCHNFPGKQQGSSFSSKHKKLLVNTSLCKFDPMTEENWTKGKWLAEWPVSQVDRDAEFGLHRSAGSTSLLCATPCTACDPVNLLVNADSFLWESGKFMTPNLGGVCLLLWAKIHENKVNLW